MSNIQSQSIGIHLSRDPETEGFDLQAGESWIYPTNYPVREYQFNIIQKALLKNTLVSLPTGLGKTFIAAVVMFNYFRWYPQGKVVFMAPTRPLVKQQIDACFDIMAIPKEATVEITGTGTKVSSREEIWSEKRVFFITPQILQNDLERFNSLGPKIKCLVFDEAHRARGNHAYCEVIRKLSTTNKYFRVLALSATPGGSIEDVLEVVQNLWISHLEFRTEESLDVSPYVFQRNLMTVVVPLGEKLQQVKDNYMKVLEYYTRTLMRYNIVQGNCANLTKGKIFMLSKNYQQKQKNTSPNYGEIMKCLNICITLYHAAELLIRHGLRSFLNFYEEHIDKPLLKGNTTIREIMADIKEYLGPPPQIQSLPDGDYAEISGDVKFGHPKFYKLRDILLDHFKESDISSRVIVFFEYRESVMEAYALLIQSKPIIKPRMFVGQKNGVTQKSQINVIKSFREGTCNILLSTCIGEEGLDVGDVDLIICFDISNKSPIRMVQRMGRTGRKRDGKIVVLVTEGKEQETLKDCLIHKNNVAYHVLGSKYLANSLKKECPRLIPEGIVPKCEKIFITVQKPVPKKNGNLKDMLKTLSSKSSELLFSPTLEIVNIQERIPTPQLLSITSNEEDCSLPNVFNKRIEKQRSFQETYKVDHSENCELLVNLLQMAESRRFNIPMSQISKTTQNKNLKQADIRNMFIKTQSAKDFDLPPTQIQVDIPNIAEDKNFGPSELFTEIANFLAISDTDVKKCKLCPLQIQCGKIPYKNYSAAIFSWVELDSSVYTSVTINDLELFDKTYDASFQFDETLDFQVPNTPINKTKNENGILDSEDFIDKSILTDIYNKSYNFHAPQSLNNLLNKYSTSVIENSHKSFSEDDIQNILNFFKLNSLANIFEENRNEKTKSDSDESCSPILCSFVNKRKVIKKNFGSHLNGKEITSTPIEVKNTPKINKTSQVEKPKLELEDVFDLSSLGFPSQLKNNSSMINSSKKSSNMLLETPVTQNTSKSSAPEKPKLTLEDLVDFSFFGLPSDKDYSIDDKNPSQLSNTNLIKSSIDKTSTPLTQKEVINTPKTSKILATEKPELTLEDIFDFSSLGLPLISSTSIKKPLTNDSINIFSKQKGISKNCLPSQASTTQLLNRPSEQKDNLNSKLHHKTQKEIISLPTTPKTSKALVRKKPELELEDLFDLSSLGLPSNKKESLTCRENSLIKASQIGYKKNNPANNTSGKKETEDLKNTICSPTQTSITQLLSLINKPTQLNKLSQKENILDDDSDHFTFSFNKKSQHIKTQKLNNDSSKFDKINYNSSLNMSVSSKNDTSDLNKNIQNCSLLNSSNNDSSDSDKTVLNISLLNSSKNSSASVKNDSFKSSKNDSSLLDKTIYNNSLVNCSVSPKLNESDKNITHSDDDFDMNPKSPIWVRPKTVARKRKLSNDSDEDFEISVTSPIWNRSKTVKKVKVIEKKSKAGVSKPENRKLVHDFIENEAEVSFCDTIDISDDEIEKETQDHYEASFVSDETQNVNSEMHAVYLKSIRSQVFHNRFKIPLKMRTDINIFSQEDNIEDDTYLDDSFVVDDEIVESQKDLSQLEILEKELELQRKRKKMPHAIKKPSKRKRVICIDSDSD